MYQEQAFSSSEGYVYIISLKDTSLYKIGVSRQPTSRLKHLQLSSPHTLEIVFAKQSHSPYLVEFCIHEMFKANQKTREWFDLTKWELGIIIRKIQLLVKLPKRRT